ncbi:hypothetical protein KY290_033942 [Solanum tuberosum]|uniref:Uncharacterized protein n=1 Tax=Solanum tuberosum TaxID=4113 RepID=A0ABQ7U3Q7_SOLTU|nr:hypothetical protein KY289_033325 [Solanum tuberosum]KAH0647967.1 hypothetical protein KY285_033215 [Solanum tuberosum]KAH0740899.1 hypothetical protein KY290_033942 [Solanum tuberosum]
MGVYIVQEVSQEVQAKQAAPMSAMLAVCVEEGVEFQICLTRTWGAPKGLSLSARAACGESILIYAYQIWGQTKKSESYNPFYEYENGLKLHGGVKEVKTSKYNQTTPNLEVG